MMNAVLSNPDCLSKQSQVSQYLLAEQTIRHTMGNHSSAAEEPCISNGGSPFRFKDCPRITDAIFTEPYSHLYRYCGVTSQKSMSGIGNVRHQVDTLSTKNSSKEYRVALLPPSSLVSRLSHYGTTPLHTRLIKGEAVYV
ncbi:hypothetical protein VINI7043_01240 [Vibrio nigripulchritudo ATCC 27043]|nr:hypothetical protein VINI7043_01240 [Vibrio nigripulchritudo ATCC 27043]